MCQAYAWLSHTLRHLVKGCHRDRVLNRFSDASPTCTSINIDFIVTVHQKIASQLVSRALSNK